MKTFIKRSGLVLALLLTALVLYEIRQVQRAGKIVKNEFLVIHKTAQIYAEDLTDNQKKILLRIEDPNFYDHKGLDFSTPGAGMTTITQAITKRIFFENFKPGFAKIEQSLIARYVVHPKTSKDMQLTAFLNLTYFGRCKSKQITGYVEAADCYLDKSFDQLTDQDFINLTARLIAPNRYNRDAAALDNRITKINNLLAGKCDPTGLRDVMLEGC